MHKIVVLMLILIAIAIPAVKCAFFDLTDVDDPLALLWNTKDAIINYKNRNCDVLINGHNITGQCKHPSHCLLSGGKMNGFCGVLSTCCTYNGVSCTKSTNAKVSYFESGDNLNWNTDCQYTVHLLNNNICQVRLDFETFKLTAAQQILVDDVNTLYSYQCSVDYLTISPTQYNYSIPVICGYNYGQHLYLHIDPSVTRINLGIHLGDRNIKTAVSDPHWRIKITQLECPGSWNLYKHKDNTLAKDFQLLAPDGILQYYLPSNGRFTSFGYDFRRSAQSYATGSQYAIGFKRPPNTCQIKFTINYFNIRSSSTALTPVCLSYLFVPGLTWKITDTSGFLTTTAYQICSTKAITSAITFNIVNKGPFYLELVTNLHDQSLNNLAFDLNYEYINCTGIIY